MDLDIDADFVAENVPAILVLFGLIFVLVGWLGSGVGLGVPWWAWLLVGLGIVLYLFGLGSEADGG